MRYLGRLAGCVWERRYVILVAIVLGALVSALDAYAQPRAQVLKHEFEGHTVYLVLVPLEGQAALLEVWRRQDGRCAMYPSVVELTAEGIQFRAGTAWRLQEAQGGVRITFPNERALIYRPARADPQTLCTGTRGT